MAKSQNSIDNISILTDNLKLDDKIAFVFLLCQDLTQSLYLIDFFKSSDCTAVNNLFRHFLYEDSGNFERIIEGLSVIRNYKAARLLGYSKDQVIKHSSKNLINSVKKKLYFLAEKLTEKETLNLVASVSGDLRVNCNHLEQIFLEWDKDKIISLGFNNSPVDITKITESLSEYDNIKAILEKNETIHVVDTNAEIDCEYYPIIDENEVGFCVVINQQTFTRNKELSHLLPEHDLPPRMGSEKDVEALKNIFSKMAFQVRTHSNIGFEELRNLLPEYAQSIPPHHSCFVLCIMSHGTENVFYTADSVPVSVESIEMAFQRNNCPRLVGKPKILVIQACQGSDLQRAMLDNVAGATTLDTCTLGPERGDALIAWSTVKGFASFRDKYQGSWFIQHLCEELSVSAGSRDLVDVITRVNGLLRHKTCNGMFMVPALSSSLCKKVRLPYRR